MSLAHMAMPSFHSLCDKALVLKGGQKGGKAFEKEDEGGDKEGNGRGIWLERGGIWQRLARDALRLETSHESNVREQNREPNKPTKDLQGSEARVRE